MNSSTMNHHSPKCVNNSAGAGAEIAFNNSIVEWRGALHNHPTDPQMNAAANLFWLFGGINGALHFKPLLLS
jgi:hypothetical protein